MADKKPIVTCTPLHVPRDPSVVRSLTPVVGVDAHIQSTNGSEMHIRAAGRSDYFVGTITTTTPKAENAPGKGKNYKKQLTPPTEKRPSSKSQKFEVTEHDLGQRSAKGAAAAVSSELIRQCQSKRQFDI